MTKMKSKKITKSTIALIIMGIAMVAMLAFGGTFAYFTATANSKSATVTTAVIKLTSGEAVNSTITDAVYGTPVLGAVTYDATGTTADSYVFVKLTSQVTTEGVTWDELFGAALAVEGDWQEYTPAEAVANSKIYYTTVTTANAGEIPFLTALTIKASPNYVEGQPQPKTMGATATISVVAKSVQKDYLNGVDDTAKLAEAYNATVKGL